MVSVFFLTLLYNYLYIDEKLEKVAYYSSLGRTDKVFHSSVHTIILIFTIFISIAKHLSNIIWALGSSTKFYSSMASKPINIRWI